VEHKKVEFDHALFGSIGLESCFGMLQKYCTTEQAVTYLTRLKDVFGIPMNTIAEGNIAAISLFNPDETWTFTEDNIYSASKNASALGQKLKGRVYGTYANKKL